MTNGWEVKFLNLTILGNLLLLELIDVVHKRYQIAQVYS